MRQHRCGLAQCPGPLPGRVPGPEPATSHAELAAPVPPCAAVCRAPPAVSLRACSPSPAPACSREAHGAGSRTRRASAAGSPRSRTPASGPPGSAPWRSRSFEPGPKLVAVVGPHEKLRPFHRGELGAAPVPVLAARHVGDHRMGVQLRIQVAARQVAEGRRDHAVGPYPRPATRLRVVAPGLEQLRLDEAQRGLHRLVVRPYHPCARLGPRVDQRLQRDRLGRREGRVHARPVLMLAVVHPPEAKVGVWHVAGEDGLEVFWFDGPVQAEQIRRLAVPVTGLAVLRIVLRVVAVHLEVVHRRGGGLQPCDGRDHPALPVCRRIEFLLGRRRGQDSRVEGNHHVQRRIDMHTASDRLNFPAVPSTRKCQAAVRSAPRRSRSTRGADRRRTPRRSLAAAPRPARRK